MTCTEMVHNYTRGMCDCKQAEAVATAKRRGLLRAAELVEEGAGVADCAVEMARENGDEEEARICERIAASKRQEAARLRQEAGGE